MADRVFLHIGAPKSGTTYLQTVLWANQARLRDHGLLLPGVRRAEHNSLAVWGRTPRPRRGTQRAYDRLLDQIRAWDGPAIVSSEWFTMLDRDLAERFVRGLEPAEVQLIFTARNLVGAVPAAWQERLKLGDSLELDAFVDSLETTENLRWNWGTLDASEVLPRWTPVVPASRIHLVTVPPPGAPRDLLWTRFARACGLPADAVDLDKGFANESVGVESARLLQLIGPQLRTAVDADTIGGNLPYRWIRNHLSHQLLAARGGAKIALAERDLAAVNARSERLVEHLGAAGYRIHGDLDDLRQGTNPAHAVRPEQVTDTAVMETALAVIPELLGELRRTHERLEEKDATVEELRTALAERPPAAATHPTATTPPVAPRPGGLRRRLRRRQP